MPIRKRVFVLLGAAFTGAAAAIACSSEPDVAPSPTDGGVESAARDQRAPDPVDAGDANACIPQPLGRAPRFIPPKRWHDDACTRAEINGFLQSCLKIETSVCESYAKFNPKCFACAQSLESAPAWGAIVVYDGGYFDPNYAGCMANALGDFSPEGCGGAYGALIDCASEACRGCLPVTSQEAYEDFGACTKRKEVTKLCADPLARLSVACADHPGTSPSDPIYPCFDNGTDFEAFLRSYLEMFCMPAPDAGSDAGDDAADGG